jgi:hypothetical protein
MNKRTLVIACYISVFLYFQYANPGNSTHLLWVTPSTPSALFHLSLTTPGLYSSGYAVRGSSTVSNVVILRQLHSNGDLQSPSWRYTDTFIHNPSFCHTRICRCNSLLGRRCRIRMICHKVQNSQVEFCP